MTVAVTADATFSPGPPQALPIKTERDFIGARYTYDVADLGQRFLVTRNTTGEPTSAVTVMLSWASSLSRTK
jgi:hypothetical protein